MTELLMNNLGLVLGLGGALALGATIFVALLFRRVVPTNEVHIVQNKKTTVSFGKDTGNGNVYYEYPSFLPLIGITKIVLPVSNFDVDLNAYEAYDKGRLPFVVDIKAFFRISNSAEAAQRVASFQELKEQLIAVVQGAVRAILASSDIEEIMQGRSKFGNEFTREVKEQLESWGVDAVKNIELMDIRDSQNSKVIHNIMEKKKSFIEMESRQAVAENRKKAEVAEIEAGREINVQKQEALRQIGTKTIETEREVALATEKKKQDINETAKITIEKEKEAKKVMDTRDAEIARQVQVIKAEQDKQTAVLAAEAKLEAVKKNAEGIALEGQAIADAEKAKLLAPVEAQLTLAKEIGENSAYQNYLISIEQVKAAQTVGMEQAKALTAAQIKIIANTGDASSGMNSVLDVLSSKGGTQLGAMLEGLSNTDVGKAALKKIGLDETLQ